MLCCSDKCKKITMNSTLNWSLLQYYITKRLLKILSGYRRSSIIRTGLNGLKKHSGILLLYELFEWFSDSISMR